LEFLAAMPASIREQIAIEIDSAAADGWDERDTDAQRKRDKRTESARIVIPPVVNMDRRLEALSDPFKFLKTYLADRYQLAFGRHHQFMIESIVSRARNGGRQAVAAPRGCGKSEIVKGLLVYLVLSELIRFPLAVAATSSLAKRLFRDFRTKFGTNQLLYEDFPEVCHPVRCLEGAPQRAARQHIDGVLTNIVWTSNDYLRLPNVPGSPYGGVKMAYFGLDAAFRGVNIDGDRPDFIMIDDPETAESAKSDLQIGDREETLDKDIAGLAGQESSLTIVTLTTVQNAKCLSFKLTDRSIKPSHNGVRFGMIEKWPERMDLWEEYIAIRRANQEAGDEHGLNAVAHYIDNWDAMNAGVEMLVDYFVEVEVEGVQLVHSAIQQAFNKIADTSLSAYKSEYQNDPDPDEQPDTVGLTAGKVASRISGLIQGEKHPDTEFVTIGLDIGKYFSHWVKVGWHGNAIGNVLDYGVMETPGMMTADSSQAVMNALLPALLQWRIDMIAETDIDFCLVDSGDYTDAVYEFIRQVGGTPFAAAKGWDPGRFHMPKERKADKIPFTECYASHLPAERLWLYNVQTEYWKQWVHERFVTATFDEQQIPNSGTLSLYAAPGDRRRHLSFSQHVVAEERRDIFVPGKGIQRKWVVVNRNNHYLDAVALACAAAGCLGVRVIPRVSLPAAIPAKPQPQRPAILNPYGQPFLATERN
jgi:hypothetical protein